MNSKKIKISNIIVFVLGNRTILTLLLAVIFIVVMGSLRPKKSFGMYEKRYWATKISWRDYADIVIAGDSRILAGISPSAMQEILQDRCIVNYGFVNNLYVPEYLEALEGVLKKKGDRRIVILGITPHSFTKNTDVIGQFYELINLSRKEIFINIKLAAIMSFFDYMSFRDVLLGIFPSLESRNTTKEFFANGWMAMNRMPAGEKNELKKYRRIYQKYKVSQNMIDNFSKYVSDWTESQIKVYGFLVPTCIDMVNLEEELSGFNLSEFESSFEKAGGIWINIRPTDYDSFDGSHLQRESAIKLSRDLALRIYEIEQHNL